ncbi:1223_t:CDS:2 [Funneliformis geosporum]|nr:1223_t:CDS:2 [Funneliformis geosporum]
MDVIIFHNKCDDKGATIFVAKINGTNYIVGGYNPLDWNSPGKGVYKTTSDSFIFFFDDYRDVKAGKLGRVLNAKALLHTNYDFRSFLSALWCYVIGKSLEYEEYNGTFLKKLFASTTVSGTQYFIYLIGLEVPDK